MRFLIKYATRGRLNRFNECIRNIQSTISTNDYRIIISIDDDDKEMIERLDSLNEMHHIRAYSSPRTSKIGAINRDINHVHEDWDILINFSDDMRFIVPEWDKIIINRIREIWPEGTDFFAHFSDSYVCDKLPTMSIMGREYYERFFYIYPPCYKSVSCDAEAMYVAMLLGRHHYFPEVLFRHEHPVNIKGKMDQLYNENNKYEKEDTETYFKRLNKNFYVNGCHKTPFDQFKKK